MQLGSNGEEPSGMQVRVGCTLCWNSIQDIENPQRIHRKMPFGGLFYFIIRELRTAQYGTAYFGQSHAQSQFARKRISQLQVFDALNFYHITNLAFTQPVIAIISNKHK